MSKLVKFSVRSALSSAIGLGLLAVAAASSAAPIVFGANLRPGQEVPAVISAGSGSATVTLDGTLLSVALSFSGLTSNTVFAHIHCCAAAGANGPVAIDFGAAFPVGVTAGTFSGTFDLTSAATFTSGFRTANPSFQTAFVNGLLAGNTYINVHTVNNRGGEIRGQIPLPTSLVLLLPGLLGLGLMRVKSRA
jgi:CHRD domain